MPTITRTWLAFAAIGTGLIHLALVIGAPLALGIVLAALGLAEFGWGVLTFARDHVPLARAALIVAIAPMLAWGLLLVISTLAEMPGIAASVAFVPLAVATAFELFAALVLARHLRLGAAEARGIPSVGRYLIAIVAGGLVVAAMTTPALAATQAGQFAQPHSDATEPAFYLQLPEHGAGH